MNRPSLWHSHCPPTWPGWARDWACTPGSLTRRLVGLGHGFEVEPVYQGHARVRGLEHTQVQLKPGARIRARHVRLKVSGRTVVVAQTLLKWDSRACDWPFWRGLGTRSLGSVLFSDPLVRRGALRFARIPAHTPWVQALMPSGVGHAAACPHVFARCARYERGSGRTPLWVFEVFLPALQAF